MTAAVLEGDDAGAGDVVRPPDYAGRWARALRARIAQLVARAADSDGVAVRWPRAVCALLEALARHASREGDAWPSLEGIAAAVCYSVRHVQRAVDEACRVGLLVRRVPDYAARVTAGATTHYGLPWWAHVRSNGLRIVARVQRALALRTPKQSAAVTRALEAVAPEELLSRVLRTLPPALAATVVAEGGAHSYAAAQLLAADGAAAARRRDPLRVLGPDDTCTPEHPTRRPDKTADTYIPPHTERSGPSQTGKDAPPAAAGGSVTPARRSPVDEIAARIAAMVRRRV